MTKEKEMTTPALHISSDAEGESSDAEGQHIIVETLKPERFAHYGFGTFLENIVQGEVTITAAAKRILLAAPERPGLQGLEFWPDNRIAWGSRSPTFTIPIQDINVPEGAKEWIGKLDSDEPSDV